MITQNKYLLCDCIQMKKACKKTKKGSGQIFFVSIAKRINTSMTKKNITQNKYI